MIRYLSAFGGFDIFRVSFSIKLAVFLASGAAYRKLRLAETVKRLNPYVSSLIKLVASGAGGRTDT
jgi:hypothetical protein